MTRSRPTPAAYHLLSLRQKQAGALAQAREQAIRCERCWTQVMPSEYLKHFDERCPGRPEPGPRSTWLTWTQALGFGIRQDVLRRWVRYGFVRTRGELTERRYLLDDVVTFVVRQRELKAAEAKQARCTVRGESLPVQLEMPFAVRRQRG